MKNDNDMVKKLEYSKPNLVELDVDQTAGGKAVHDECKLVGNPPTNKPGHGRLGSPICS